VDKWVLSNGSTLFRLHEQLNKKKYQRPNHKKKVCSFQTMIAISSYEKELFLQPPSDHFECPICLCIMKDPVSCREGHTFCRYCVSKHLDVQPLTTDKLVPNRLIRSLIEDSEVHCISNEDSCDWTGKLKDAESHYINCPFSPFKISPCPHNGCDDVCIQRDLPLHMKNCLYRLVPCDWCDLSDTIDVIYSHTSVCPKRPVPCPNGCFDSNGKTLSICHDEVANHCRVCIMKEVDCAFAISGCNAKRPRRDTYLHESDFACMRVRHKKKCQLQLL
jgi:TNF receptor-associated factor 4